MAKKKIESEETPKEEIDTASSDETSDDELLEEAEDTSGSGEDPVEPDQTPTVPPAEAEALAAAAEKEDEPEPEPEAKPKVKEKAAAKKKPDLAKKSTAPSADADEEELISNEEAAATLFGPGGKESASTPISELPGSEDEPLKHAGFLVVLAAVVLGAALAAGAYGILNAEQKHCLHLQLQSLSCVEYYDNLNAGRMDEDRREAVANAPRVGTVSVTTTPNNLRVTSSGQPETLFLQGNTLAAPARSKITFQDVPADAAFSFTIHGDGVWQDRVVELPDYRSASTLWIQNPMTGDYSAELNFRPCYPGSAAYGASNCLYPAERALAQGTEAWEEMRWRTTWQPPAEPEEGQPTRLENATITVNSTPSGARVQFNGRAALGPDGQPCTTPCTFTHYAPADNAEPAEDGTPPENPAVYLSREGLPLEVYIEGKLPTRTSVFAHNFVCNPMQDAAITMIESARPGGFASKDFMGFCNYQYDVNLQILDPPAPEPEDSDDERASN
jgi:hypothetical protein